MYRRDRRRRHGGDGGAAGVDGVGPLHLLERHLLEREEGGGVGASPSRPGSERGRRCVAYTGYTTYTVVTGAFERTAVQRTKVLSPQL